MSQSLHRLFWSLYGRFVWDAQQGARHAALVRRVAEGLRARARGPAERVLDAGCGTGNYALALARSGFQVTGVDYAPGMLARACRKVPVELADRLTFRREDLNAGLPFPEHCFDHAINVSMLQVARDVPFLLRELGRVLRPGGTLVLVHFPRPASHDRPLGSELRECLSAARGWNPGRALLVVAKVMAERWGGTRYWSATELRALLETADFTVLGLEEGPPIIALGEKPNRPEPDAEPASPLPAGQRPGTRARK